MPVYHQKASQTKGREDPEDGALSKRIYQLIGSTGTRAILGFASEAGVKRNKGRLGAKQAPAAIRNALASLAAPEGFTPLVDLGDIVVDDDDLEDGQVMLGEHIAEALTKFERVIVFGGGHETAFGSFLGLRAAFPGKQIGIINLDAHLDLRNIGEAGPSSGTPFNQIRELAPERFDYLCLGAAQESNTAALFTRAKEWGVRIVSDKALLANPTSADGEISEMAKRCDVIYLTIDIDLLPHYQAPGVSAPAVRGVPFQTVEYIIEVVQRVCAENSCKLPLADLVEVSPPHDQNNMTSKSAAVLALGLLS